jgi:hypothetical protein
MNSINSTGERLPLSGVVIPGPPSRGFPARSLVSASTIHAEAASPWISPLLLAALCILNAFWPEFSTRYAWVPFLASLFFLGMPHGASDFARMSDFFGAGDWKNRFLFFSVYLFGMGLVLLLSLPLLLLVLLLLLLLLLRLFLVFVLFCFLLCFVCVPCKHYPMDRPTKFMYLHLVLQ